MPELDINWLLPFASVAYAAEALLFGMVIGGMICFTGVGGGLLVLPVLTFFFDMDVSIAVGTASAYTTLTKSMAAVEHIHIRTVNYRLFAKMSFWALPGLLISAVGINWTLHHKPALAELMQDGLRIAVAMAMALSLLLILFSRHHHKEAEKITAESAPGKPVHHRRETAKIAAESSGIGLILGATGVGGGALFVPALLLMGEAPKRVVGTSILIALVLSAVTALLYSAGGQIHWLTALWMAAGSLLAMPLASRLLEGASEALVERVLLVLIATSAVVMLLGE